LAFNSPLSPPLAEVRNLCITGRFLAGPSDHPISHNCHNYPPTRLYTPYSHREEVSLSIELTLIAIRLSLS
jgi:hypothetical protein